MKIKYIYMYSLSYNLIEMEMMTDKSWCTVVEENNTVDDDVIRYFDKS